MTNRERELASLGFEYAEGIERAFGPLVLPGSGREVRRTAYGWEVQPWDDNYWVEFADVLDAIRAGTRAEVGRQPTDREAAAMSDERNEKSRLVSSRAMSNTGYHANGKPRWWARAGTGTDARFLEIPF